MDKHLLTLAELENGRPAVVETLHGGQHIIRRLAAMGILPGAHILKEEGHGAHGPVVVLVRGARMALGHGMASKIFLRQDGR
ncbi:MAG TPA: FeoA family protein [Elusimicrobiales bacterium]|nr:FeoA family protein [Elusimicrobiales bacterium]